MAFVRSSKEYADCKKPDAVADDDYAVKLWTTGKEVMNCMWEAYSKAANEKMTTVIGSAVGELEKAEDVMKGRKGAKDWMHDLEESSDLDTCMGVCKTTLAGDKQVLYDLAAWPDKLEGVPCGSDR